MSNLDTLRAAETAVKVARALVNNRLAPQALLSTAIVERAKAMKACHDEWDTELAA